MRRIPIACVALLALLAVAPLTAHASRAQSVTFEAPRDLLDPATRPAAMERIASLGASSLRVILYWNNVAPSPNARTRPGVDLTDPANYSWGQYDPLLADAQARGWPVILTVSGPVPRWATKAKKDHLTDPSPADFQRFMVAVGRRYGGQVATWSIWNEPNHPDFLLPQYRKGKRPVSGSRYRALFLAAWRGLRRSGNGTDTILAGETAPVGTGKVVAPLTFLRQALCLDGAYRKRRSCSNLPADGWAHHAYSTRLGPFYKPDSPNAVTIGVLSRLVTALDRAASAGALRAKTPIYLTEFGVQSYPDRLAGVPLWQQPDFYAISERIAYSNPRVASFSQYLLRDDRPGSKGQGGGFGGFESGLEMANGKRKPAYNGFRLPLTVTRTGRRGVAIWGHVRPATAATTATIERRDGSGAWRRLKTLKTDARGYLTTSSTYRDGRRWRLTWAAPDGRTYRGAVTRSYRRP